MPQSLRTYTSFAAVLVAFAALYALHVPRVHAIGISPPVIRAIDILRSSAQTYTVTLLVDTPAASDLSFEVAPRGEYGHYVKGPAELIIPKGKTSAVYTFELQPTDAAVGSYTIELAFTEKSRPADTSNTAPAGSVDAKLSVLQGAILVISMGVSGEEKVSFDVQHARFEDTELRLPLVGTYTIHNTGNVEWKPDRIEVVVTEVNNASNTDTYAVAGDDIALTKPGTVTDARIALAHKLAIGTYVAHLNFRYKDAIVAQVDTAPFTVFNAGTLNQSGELVDVTTDKKVYKAGEQIVVTGLFKNTGDVTVQGQLETTTYKDGALVNLEVSRTLSVDPRQETEFQQFLNIAEPGEYQLQVAATYGNRKTQAHTVTIVVESADIGTVLTTLGIIALGIVFAIGICTALVLVIRRYRKKKALEQATIPPVVVPQAPSATIEAMSAQPMPPSNM